MSKSLTEKDIIRFFLQYIKINTATPKLTKQSTIAITIAYLKQMIHPTIRNVLISSLTIDTIGPILYFSNPNIIPFSVLDKKEITIYKTSNNNIICAYDTCFKVRL